jgi:hypothetical protein
MKRRNLLELDSTREFLWVLVVSGALLLALPIPVSSYPEPPASGSEVSLQEIERIATERQFHERCGDMVGNSRKFEACRKKLTVFRNSNVWIDSGFLVSEGEKISPEHLDLLHGFSADSAEASRLAVTGLIAGWCRHSGRATTQTFKDLARAGCFSSLPTLAEMGFKLERLDDAVQVVNDKYDSKEATTWIVEVPEIPKGQVSRVRLFRFDVQLEKADGSQGVLVLRKGTVLQPIDRGDRAKIYQSMVLCEEVQLRFGADGRSQSITLNGFCFNPSLAIPPEGVRWLVTELNSSRVQDRCDLEVMAETRDVKKPKAIFNRTLFKSCPFKSVAKCRDYFDAWLRINKGGRGYDSLYADDLCVINMIPGQDAFGLFCDLD